MDDQAVFNGINAYADASRRESKREAELMRLLRQVPEESRHKFILNLLDRRLTSGLLFFAACTNSSSLAREVLIKVLIELEAGSIASGISNVRGTIPPIQSKLGIENLLRILSDSVEEYPKAVSCTLVWLSVPKHKFDEDSLRRISALKSYAARQLPDADESRKNFLLFGMDL
jgi:hypothetical protein